MRFERKFIVMGKGMEGNHASVQRNFVVYTRIVQGENHKEMRIAPA